VSTGSTQSDHSEGPVALASDAEQGLRVSGVGISDDGNLSWLRKVICQRLKPVAQAQWILGQERLYLSQRLVRDVDITYFVGEAG
jgi:hypothetical protein